MPRFLGLKTYLTTNRSSIVKQDATSLRRSRLSKMEILREEIADKLKCPLCFCLPCFVGVTVMLMFIIMYVTVPYMRGLNYQMTQCTVEKVELSEKGSCSSGTERFTPCYKIMVKYNTSEVKVSVLMENEQTLFHCEKCSFTFGKGSLFTKNKCSSPRTCLETYHEKHGTINEKYSCFYDPANPQNVFKEYKISRTETIYQTSLPVIFVFLLILSFVFVQYDELKRRKLNEEIKVQTHRHTVGTHRHKTDIPSYSTDSGTSESPSSSGSTAAMYRVRKKKMPCTKAHVLSTRDEEDVIMEEKPISPSHMTHSNVFMQVNVEKLKTHCACVNHASLGNNFELTREQERFRPVMPSQHYYQNQLQRSRRALRYLPESVV